MQGQRTKIHGNNDMHVHAFYEIWPSQSKNFNTRSNKKPQNTLNAHKLDKETKPTGMYKV